MEKVIFRNNTNFNLKIFSQGKELPLFPSQEELDGDSYWIFALIN